jgi:hypothetical protein
MTIASPVSSASFQGNGVTLSFPLPFRFVSTADVTVVLRDAGGGESLLTETTDYTLSGAGEASGGVCVLAGPPLTGQTLVCTRDPRIVQETDYQENDAFPAESHEAALDLLTMICQALDERLGRAPLLPVSCGLRRPVLAEPAAGRALVWDQDGRVLGPGPSAAEIATAQGFALAAQSARSAAEAARDAALAAAASMVTPQASEVPFDPAASGLSGTTVQAALDELAGQAVAPAALDQLRTLLLAEALRRAVGDAENGREFLGNGWIDPLGDAGEVAVTLGSFVSAEGGYLTNAGADAAVTAVDLAAAQFLDEKGSITGFTCDTAHRSGHFSAAKGSRVIAGCRMVIGGVSYPIASISGDGTAANAVAFNGVLAPGAYTVTAVFGPELSGADLTLTSAWLPNIPVMTGNGPQGGVTVSASTVTSPYEAYKAFDNDASAASAWLSTSTSPFWVKMDLGSSKTIHRYSLTAPGVSGLDRMPITWTLQGSATGAFSGEQVTVDSRSAVSWSSGESKNFDLASAAAYRYWRILMTANGGNTLYSIIEMQLYTRVTPAAVVYPAALSVGCMDWTAITAVARTSTLNGQSLWYAVSFDGGTTYSAFVSPAWLPIVRNNGGAWEYWTGSAWAASAISSALGAMIQAAAVAGNRMDGASMVALSQAQIEGTGGFAEGQTSLPVLVALYSASTTAAPILSALSLTADIQPHDMVAEFDSYEAVNPDQAKAVLVLQAVDGVTLDTDLKAWVKRGEGEYVQAPLVVDSAVDLDRVLVAGDLDLGGSGTATRLKLTCHNHKELRIHAAANCFRSV